MATDLRTDNEPSVTHLVTGIINDAQTLLKQQFEMLKHEVKEDLRKTREAGLMVGVGAGFALVGGILLVQMLVLLTHWLAPTWPEWVCYGIWGAVMFLVGAGLAYAGKLKFDSFNILPEETAQSVKENVEWITNPK